MLESLLRVIAQHRRITLSVALGVFLVAAWLASRLSLNDSPERWMPASSVEAWRRFEEHYDYGDTIAIASHLHGPVRNEDIDLLRAIYRDLKRIEGIARVTDVSLLADQIEDVPLTTLLRTPPPGEEDPFAMYRGIFCDDPRLQEAADPAGPSPGEPAGRTLLTFLELKAGTTPGADPQARQAELDQRRRGVVAGIYRVLDEHQRDDVTYHVAGGVVIQFELERIARRLVVTVVPLSVLLALLALGVGFRSVVAVVIVVLGGLWSVVMMLGSVALAGWSLNVVTVGGPTLMAVVAMTTVIHYAHYYSGRGPADGHEESHFIRWVGVPCLGVAIVTGVGFLMLAFNELSPSRELGIELFAGAILAFLGTFLVWMAIHPFRAAPARFLTDAGFRRYLRLVVARPWTVTVVLVAVMAASGWATWKWVRTDVDPFSFFQPGSRIARAFRHFSERKFGLYNLDVVLVPRQRPEDPAAREAARAEDQRLALEFQRGITRQHQDQVRNVISAVDLLARMKSFGLNLKGFNLKRALVFAETFKNWTEDRADRDSLRITFMVCDTGAGFGPLVKDVAEGLRPLGDRFECVYTGTAANVVTLSENLVGGIMRGLMVAAAVMAVLCLFLFRSIRLMLVAVLPNALPVMVVFGIMGAFDIPLNSGSAMVSTIALGIALNDTIHLVMHYHRRRESGEPADRALVNTFGELGRPIVLTSVVNCVGFGIFLFSDFRPMYHFGLLASISMVAALAGDIVMLPNLLKLFDREPSSQRMPPSADSPSVKG